MSTLFGVYDASAQLADGSVVYLETDGDPVTSVWLRHVDTSDTVTTIESLPLDTIDGATGSFLIPDTLQAITLTVDRDENIYVFGRESGSGSTTDDEKPELLRAYSPDGSGSWEFANQESIHISWTWDYAGGGDVRSMTWVNEGSGLNGRGRLFCISDGGRLSPPHVLKWPSIYMVLNCDALLTGEGAVVVDSNSVDWHNMWGEERNWSGHKLSVDADIFGGDYVCVIRAEDNAQAQGGGNIISRISLKVDTTLSEVREVNANDHQGLHCRFRVTGIGNKKWLATRQTRYDFDAKRGVTFEVLTPGSSSLKIDSLDIYDITDHGENDYFYDSFYEEVNDTAYLYEFSGDDLQRVPFYLYSGFLGDPETINAYSAGTRTHIRTAERVFERRHVPVHHDDADTYVIYRDQFNDAPLSPVTQDVDPFDADTEVAQFNWEFSDIDPDDEQTAYEFEIRRTSDSVMMVQTGKQTSSNEFHQIATGTLTNGTDYQYRVRTWDIFDAQGPYSGWHSFRTVSPPTVTIDSPADSATIEIDSISLEWTYSQPDNAVQDEFRVVLFDEFLNVVRDTDWVFSEDTVYDINLLQPGDYTVEVSVSAQGQTDTDSVDVTLDFDVPPAPDVTITSEGDEGYVLIDITNPADPTGLTEVIGNNIYRRRLIDEEFSPIATGVEPDGQYEDRAISIGIPYEYYVKAIAVAVEGS